MAKKALLTVNGTHKKVKKGFLTVDSKHRKIKKAYMTVGGVFRPFWGGGEISYYGAITSLSAVRAEVMGASTGSHALFAGGNKGSASTSSNVVEAYDKSLTRSLPTVLSRTRTWGAGACAGKSAVFNSGDYSGGASADAYDTSLTRSTVTATAKQWASSATFKNYAMFFGGQTGASTTTGVVEIFSSSLTRSTATSCDARQACASAANDEYAIVGGGYYRVSGGSDKVLNTAYAYDSSFTRISVSALNGAKDHFSAASANNYIIFAGGNSTGTVDAYDKSLTKIQLDNLPIALERMGATSLDDFAIFAGGRQIGKTYLYKTAYVYDASLTRTSDTALSIARDEIGAVSFGDYALFGGGMLSSTSSATVDCYTLV